MNYPPDLITPPPCVGLSAGKEPTLQLANYFSLDCFPDQKKKECTEGTLLKHTIPPSQSRNIGTRQKNSLQHLSTSLRMVQAHDHI